ncbi:hypothetical protein P872_09580 [Rhodonellum psychrophilum GCM71 = DSM 17998]|uniref:non-specific protein-tyrosine kinase n=2 Tax=Rhodonellum TaxID=336827 RepID=U5BXM9_9BACT|nr:MULTISPECIES: tyrosine-protein kinase [Rhodonellum]ERM81361.1 hypothetical protein P872_09580 [Rhodonellum psychrophilum GCM71 = DSM 17998]SDZ40304.1 capsular exopolysaccharide family [Rhodonellum ikkaensis]
MQENPPKLSTSEIDILNPNRILEKTLSNWYIFLGSVFISTILAFYITKETTPIYESEGLLLISEDKNNLSLDIFSSTGGPSENTSLQNEIVNLQTYSLAYETVKQLDLNVSYFKENFFRLKPIYNKYPIKVQANWEKPQLINALFKIIPGKENEFIVEIEVSANTQIYTKQFGGKADVYSPFKGGDLGPFQGEYGQIISNPYFEFSIFNGQNENFESVYFKIQGDGSLAKKYKSMVNIGPESKGNTALLLKIAHPDKEIGELYINTLMTTFLASDLKIKSLISQQSLEFIQNQITTVADSLNQYENELQSYRTINRITNLSEKGSNILNETVKLDDELNKQNLRLEYYKNLQKYLTDPEGGNLIVPSVIGIEDPIFNNTVTNLLNLQNEKSGLKGVLAGDSFSYIRELNNKIENLKNNLKESNTNAILNISNHIDRLQDMISVVEKDFNQLPEVERNLTSIQRRFKINESIYTFLLQRKAETEIQKASTITKHRVLDAAMLNSSPISPKLSRNLAIGVSLGVSIPLLFLIIWSIFYHKVVDPKEVENLLNIPVLGFVPREKEKNNILVHNPKSIITESFRTIRSNLAIRFDFKNKGTIMVTSTRPGEGKTYISIKIASAYAALGKKTILVGMDLRKPAISKELNLIHNKFGVTTFLTQEGEAWENLIQATDQEDLEVLNAGPYLERSTELINTKKFERLMASLKEHYDFVIIDTSPIGLVSETLDLTKYTDINLFVLRQNYSFINQVQVANDLKEKMGFNNFYVVVNDMHKFGLNRHNYVYGYGYSYNSYSEDEPKGGLFRKIFR